MAVSRLLKSWAMPPASLPMASIFCAWRSWFSRLWRCVVSRAIMATPDTVPCGPRSGDSVTVTFTGAPSAARCRLSYTTRACPAATRSIASRSMGRCSSSTTRLTGRPTSSARPCPYTVSTAALHARMTPSADRFITASCDASTTSASRAMSSSALWRAVTSSRKPSRCGGCPSPPRTSTASSPNHRSPPSAAAMRYSQCIRPPDSVISSCSARSTVGRSSGWMRPCHSAGSSIHCSGVKPRMRSTCVFTNSGVRWWSSAATYVISGSRSTRPR